jgi:hypothetical protein
MKALYLKENYFFTSKTSKPLLYLCVGKTMKCIHLLIHILLAGFSFSYVLASETQGSNSVLKDGGSVALQTQVNDACPVVLQSWIEDDFKDKKSWGINYKSKSPECLNSTVFIKEKAPNQKKGTELDDSIKLGTYFSQKYSKQINPAYQKTLDQCHKLSGNVALLAPTRFYQVGVKFEEINSTIIDEIAYLDGLVGEDDLLNQIECPPIWPELKNRCADLKTAEKSCSKSQANKVAELVTKTQNLIPKIERLISAERLCIKKNSTAKTQGGKLSSATKAKISENCGPISQEISRLKLEVPWIEGSEFQKIAVTHSPAPRAGLFNTEYDLSIPTLTSAIFRQLQRNREEW